MAKHFLYLTNERLNCFLWQRGAVVGRDSFSVHDPSSRELEKYLFKHRREPVYFVLDLTEEDFRSETVPHLRGSDQTAVLNRRLGQVYRGSTFRHALIQGREAEGRRDDRVLYHGITNADLVRPWLAILERLQVPIEGIYSAPVLSGALLKSLDVFFPHTLLVSLVSGNGLRQTYFQNKQIKFSRLTPLEQTGDAGLGTQIAEETSRTWQYLDSLRFFSGEDTLEVCVLVHPRDQRDVTEAIRDFPLLQHRILNMEEVAGTLGMKPSPVSSDADELFVHLFARARLDNHFAQDDQTRVARLRKVGTALHIVNGVVLTASLAAAGVMFAQAQKISSESDRRNEQARSLSQQHQKLLSQIQIAQVSSDTSRDAAGFNAAFLEPSPVPVGFLQDISKVLNQFPDIRLQQLAWQSNDDDKVNVELAAPGNQSNLPLRSETKPQTATTPPQVPAPPAAADKTSLPGARHQVLMLNATIGPFNGDYRLMLQDIERFVIALGKVPGCSAALVKTPLDTTSQANIRGTLSKQAPAGTEGYFTVRVVRIMQSKQGGA